MLKKHQRNTLEKLTNFLQKCAIEKDVYRAYADCTFENFGKQGVYNDAGFTNIPYVCLRLPTGGGVVIEYKGSDRYNNDDSKEKRQLGDFYAGVSNGSCSFIMLNGKDWNALKNKLSIETEVKYK